MKEDKDDEPENHQFNSNTQRGKEIEVMKKRYRAGTEAATLAVSRSARGVRCGLPAIAVMAVVLVSSGASARVTKTCLIGNAPEVAGDSVQIDAVRQLIDAACVCSDFDGITGKSHADYVKCAKGIVVAQVAAAQLRPQCKVRVMTFYCASTCGRNPLLAHAPCVKKNSKGKVTCSITATKEGRQRIDSVQRETGQVQCRGLHCRPCRLDDLYRRRRHERRLVHRRRSRGAGRGRVRVSARIQ